MKLNKRIFWAASATAVVAIGAGSLVLLRSSHKNDHVRHDFLIPESKAPKPTEADQLYTTNPKAAVPKYKEFIATHEASPDLETQDQVGTSRLKIGYLAAHQKDWNSARTAFLEADTKTKGTGSTGDFGSVNEQGAYEAIVCLEASGKKDEARKQYRAFIKDRPLSPLCMACYRRLKRLNNNKATPELDALIETATKKQDADAKFESSVCGPKTLAYLCESGAIKPGSQPHDYKALAKLCHTTDSGTSITGMLDGLKALGCKPAAFRINRQDLKKVKCPALVLWGDHYITLLEVQDRAMRVYDTLTRSQRTLPLPVDSDPDFFVNAILLNGTL